MRYQDFAQELSSASLRFECVFELLLSDQPHLDQDLTQQAPRLA